MTLEIEDAALARFIDGPAPYSSGNPVPSYQTAQQELAAAFEGQAPHFSKTIADRLGPTTTAELAQVIRRAVAVGIRRRADQMAADRLAGAYDLLVAGLDQVTDGCTTPETEQLVLCGEPVGRWLCPHFKPCPTHGEVADV
jgi:hypothetical protein